MKISVQIADFDVNAELKALRENNQNIGAVVSFVGLVRELSHEKQLSAMTLEHYPEMTEKALTDIATQAIERWQLNDVTIIHRVGRLLPQAQIVFVATASAHRADAFTACEFVMDYLKTSAPFWKKEHTQTGEQWVEARESDDIAKKRWEQHG